MGDPQITVPAKQKVVTYLTFSLWSVTHFLILRAISIPYLSLKIVLHPWKSARMERTENTSWVDSWDTRDLRRLYLKHLEELSSRYSLLHCWWLHLPSELPLWIPNGHFRGWFLSSCGNLIPLKDEWAVTSLPNWKCICTVWTAAGTMVGEFFSFIENNLDEHTRSHCFQD